MTLLTYDELADVVQAVRLGLAAPKLAGGVGGSQVREQARPGALVRAVTVGSGEIETVEFTWGFPLGDGKRTVFNTRLESALGGSAMWVRALRDGRCLLPVASFFEPHETETFRSPRTGRSAKVQYEFLSDGRPLLLASVCEKGRISIVTTQPNAYVAPVHPRMPLVLRFEEVGEWLFGDYASLADRSGVALSAVREEPAPPASPAGSQLSLF